MDEEKLETMDDKELDSMGEGLKPDNAIEAWTPVLSREVAKLVDKYVEEVNLNGD